MVSQTDKYCSYISSNIYIKITFTFCFNSYSFPQLLDNLLAVYGIIMKIYFLLRKIITPLTIPRLVCETFFKPHIRGLPLRTLRQNDCPNYCPDVLMNEKMKKKMTITNCQLSPKSTKRNTNSKQINTDL